MHLAKCAVKNPYTKQTDMIKYFLTISGMSCPMCESHINSALRNNFNVTKISTSHKKGTSEFVSDGSLDEQKLKDILNGLGYAVYSIKKEDYAPKRFFLFKK